MGTPTRARDILFIDDDRDLMLALTVLLRHAGYTVRCAHDGDEGLRLAREATPDLILLDLMMPVKSGFTVCKELREQPALRDVPVIAFTAFGQNIGEVYGVRCEETLSHFRECIEKPVEPNVLLERVAEALSPR